MKNKVNSIPLVSIEDIPEWVINDKRVWPEQVRDFMVESEIRKEKMKSIESKAALINEPTFYIYNFTFTWENDVENSIGFFGIFIDTKSRDWLYGYAEGWLARVKISAPEYLKYNRKGNPSISVELYEKESWARIFFGKHKTIDIGQTDEQLKISLNNFIERYKQSDSDMIYTSAAPETFIREGGFIYDY